MDRETFKNRKKKLDPVKLDDGSDVHVRKLSQAEVEHLTKAYAGNQAKAVESLRYVVCQCLTDENGQRIYEDKDLQGEVATLDFDDVQTIAKAAMKFSGLKVDADQKGDAGKND